MKTLKISKGGLSITEKALISPVVTIGRSPACDVVLRAFGVAPVHFLLEWVGIGFFNKDKGRWILFDISKHGDSTKVSRFSGEEGIIISNKPVEFEGFQFLIEEDALAMTELAGGMIHEKVSDLARSAVGAGNQQEGHLLEVVRVNSKEQTVTDVAHHLVTGKGDGSIPAVPELKIKWSMGETSTSDLSKVFWEKGKDVKIYSRGNLVHSRMSDDKAHEEVDFRGQDFLRFDFNDQEIYLRYVQAIEVAPAEHDLFKSTGVRIGLAAILLTIALIYFVLTTPVLLTVPEVKGPPRIAKVEVVEVAPIKKVEPLPEPEPKPTPIVEKKPEIAKKAPEAKTAANSFKKPVITNKSKVGLNTPAPPANVNAVGLLGALKKNSGSQGKHDRISADMIVNSGVVTKTVSGEGGGLIIGQPPAGAVDLSARNTKRGAKGVELGAASTTLHSGDTYNLKSASPIAGKGGKSDFSVATGDGTDGLVLGGQKTNTDDLGGKEGISASGGLDKEAVRLTLQKYRRQIRTCYDKALLANPRVGGRIRYQWYISPRGPVTSVMLKSSEAKMPSFESCVQAVIKSAIFPKAPNGQPTIVIYPFVFQKT